MTGNRPDHAIMTCLVTIRRVLPFGGRNNLRGDMAECTECRHPEIYEAEKEDASFEGS
jgi:hypothetical protein